LKHIISINPISISTISIIGYIAPMSCLPCYERTDQRMAKAFQQSA
jgi:hypothetical protein